MDSIKFISGSGVSCEFKGFEINEYDSFRFVFKVGDMEKFYYNAELNKENKAVTFYEHIINGKKCGGVRLRDDIYQQFIDIENKLRIEREEKLNNIINELIEGTLKITFSIVGCDYPHYQPWVDVSKEFSAQKVMEKAVRKLIPHAYCANICDYISNCAGIRSVKTKEELGDIINAQYNQETLKYHGFKDTIVTSFELKLMDILKHEIEEKTKKDEEEQKANNFKAETSYKVVEKGVEDSTEGKDYYALVEFSDGLEKIRFWQRNIFDFGFVINPGYEVCGEAAGIASKTDGAWWWFNKREMTEFESKCVEFMHNYPEISQGVRL